MKVSTAIGAPSEGPSGAGACACKAPTTEEVLPLESVDKRPRAKIVIQICSACRWSWIITIQKIR